MKNKSKEVVTYLFGAGSSFLLDLLIFTVLFSIFKSRLAGAVLLASYLARALSSIYNYIFNKKYVFKYQEEKKKSSVLKYFTLVLVNITVSASLVSIIYEKLGFNASVIKLFIDGTIFVLNFFIQKLFIFNKEKDDNKSSKVITYIYIMLALVLRVSDGKLDLHYAWYEVLYILICALLVYFLLKKSLGKSNKGFNILAGIISLCTLIGLSFSVDYSFSYLYSSDAGIVVSVIKILGYYFLASNVLNALYELIEKFDLKGVEPIKFDKHVFGYSFLVLLLVNTMYMIFYYPGVINYDNANQIKEVLGLHTRYLDSIVVMNSNITLTNFNPILHTLLLGGFFKLGAALGSVNFGMFGFLLLQEIVLISILAYSLYFLHKQGFSGKYLLVLLLIYAVVPFYSFYNLTFVKDSLFYGFTILYIIYLYKYIRGDVKRRDYVIFFIVMALLVLFRNNGIVVILFSLPFVFLFKKNLVSAIYLTGIILFTVCFNYSLKLLEVPNTSVREGLSFVFQQSARYVKEHGSDVTKKEKDVLDKVLGYDTLASRYEPELSDKVKNEYNRYAERKDLQNYFRVWGKMFWKHPSSYLNATISNNYGYFYMGAYKWYIYSNLNMKLLEAGYDYHFNGMEAGRLALKGYANVYPFIPGVNLVVNCAFYTFAYLFLAILLFLYRKKEYIILLMPAFSMIFMCFVGPANTYFRYVLPYAASLPLVFSLILKIIKDKKTE